MYLEQNLKGLCTKFGVDYTSFLQDFDVEHAHELSIFDLEAVCEEYNIDMMNLLFKHLYHNESLKKRLLSIKFLVLDIDGVLTDEGMYVSENGDQMKKFNAKDRMAILHLTKNQREVGFLSSGFTQHMVQDRAKLLGVSKCYVGREAKITVLKEWCNELKIDMSEVAFIGDDVNDIEILNHVGVAICPKNAVNRVKTICHIILDKKGGEGCVREFIDNYLLNEPI